MELTPRQWQAVQAARKALQDSLEANYPQDAKTLECVAVAAAFSDLCKFSSAPGVRDLVAVINHELREVGLELREVRRN